MKVFDNKKILVTGGTGSLGKTLVKHLLKGTYGVPKKITVFSRDEAKQHDLRVSYQKGNNPTDEIIYKNFQNLLQFRIGDVRDYGSVASAIKGHDVVIHAAALKQVPSCEYFPLEATMTNIIGGTNIVRAINELELDVDSVVGVSTDKACLPVNVMGMSKALQERIFISANILSPKTRYLCVRYGNVLASRGSVIPLFHEQILANGPVTITTEDMTRFLIPLDHAVHTIAKALSEGKAGETFVPKIPSANMLNVAKALIGDRDIEIKVIGIRPGEKLHELMVSEEEGVRTYDRGDFYAIAPMLPELHREYNEPARNSSYSSGDTVINLDETIELLKRNNLMVDQLHSQSNKNDELLR